MGNFNHNLILLITIIVSTACSNKDVTPDQRVQPEGDLAILTSKTWRYLSIAGTDWSTTLADQNMEPLCEEGSLDKLVAKRRIRYSIDGTYLISWEALGEYDLGTEGDPNWQPRFGSYIFLEDEKKLIHNPNQDNQIEYNVDLSEDLFIRSSNRYMSKSSSCSDYQSGRLIYFEETFLGVAEEFDGLEDLSYISDRQTADFEKLSSTSDTWIIKEITLQRGELFQLTNGTCNWGARGATNPQFAEEANLTVNCGPGYPNVQNGNFNNPSGKYRIEFNQDTYEIRFISKGEQIGISIAGEFSNWEPVSLEEIDGVWSNRFGILLSNESEFLIIDDVSNCVWSSNSVNLSGSLSRSCSGQTNTTFQGESGRYTVMFQPSSGQIDFERLTMNVAGSFSGWSTLNMTLIDEHQWQIKNIRITPDTDEFKFFDKNGFEGCDWGAPKNGPQQLGLNGTLALKCGAYFGDNEDVVIGLNQVGFFDISFNEKTLKYDIVASSNDPDPDQIIYLVGFFNGWGDPLASDFPMKPISDTEWVLNNVFIDADGLMFSDHPINSQASCTWSADFDGTRASLNVGTSGFLTISCPNNNRPEFFIDGIDNVGNQFIFPSTCCSFDVYFNSATGEFSFTR